MIAQLIGGETTVVEFLSSDDQVEDDAALLVYGGRSPQGALAVMERSGSHAERGSGAAVNLACADPKDFAAADVVGQGIAPSKKRTRKHCGIL